jgi:hypothetical protein
MILQKIRNLIRPIPFTETNLILYGFVKEQLESKPDDVCLFFQYKLEKEKEIVYITINQDKTISIGIKHLDITPPCISKYTNSFRGKITTMKEFKVLMKQIGVL